VLVEDEEDEEDACAGPSHFVSIASSSTSLALSGSVLSSSSCWESSSSSSPSSASSPSPPSRDVDGNDAGGLRFVFVFFFFCFFFDFDEPGPALLDLPPVESPVPLSPRPRSFDADDLPRRGVGAGRAFSQIAHQSGCSASLFSKVHALHGHVDIVGRQYASPPGKTAQ
jgi:hypothetical protein